MMRKLKQDDTRLGKRESLFKLRGYRMEDETWKFNVIFDIHNIKQGGAKKHTRIFETEKTSKCFKYQANIQCVCSRKQGGKRAKI